MIIIPKIVSIPLAAPAYHHFEITITHGDEKGVFTGEILCPFLTKQHPKIDEIQTAVCDYFVEKHALQPDTPEMKKFNRSLFAHLVGYTCPEDAVEKVLDAAIHVGWLFILDNRVDEKGSPFRANPAPLLDITTKLKEAMEASINADSADSVILPPNTLSGFESYTSLAVINIELGSKLRGKESKHFAKSHDKYLQAIYSESVHRHTKKWMPEDGYKDLRKYTSAVTEVLEFIWSNMEVNVSKKIRENIHYRSMITHANLFVSYVNDLFSLNNEIAEDTRENIVRVIQHNRGCTLKVGIEATVGLINGAAQAFLDAKEEFLAIFKGSPTELEIARKAMAYPEQLMIGNLDWSKLTGRYKEAQTPTE